MNRMVSSTRSVKTTRTTPRRIGPIAMNRSSCGGVIRVVDLEEVDVGRKELFRFFEADPVLRDVLALLPSVPLELHEQSTSQ
jgi:hypothetical protein